MSAISGHSSATMTSTSSPGTSSTSSRLCLQSAAWPGTSALNSTTQQKTRTPRRSSSPKISAPPRAESPFPPRQDQIPPLHPAHGGRRTASWAGSPKPRNRSSRDRRRRQRSLSQPLLSQPNLLTFHPFTPPQSTL